MRGLNIKEGTKGMPFGYLEFSHAFGGKHVRIASRPVLSYPGLKYGRGRALWARFFLDQAALCSLQSRCGYGLCRCGRKNPKLGHADTGEKPYLTRCAQSERLTPTDRTSLISTVLSSSICLNSCDSSVTTVATALSNGRT